jgi:2-oxoglutarate/2-oxoacid ferredoxin oxidoreductase subunit alpha
VSLLQVKMVFPLPEADIKEFLDSVDIVVVAELNYQGQYNQIFRSKFLKETISLTKCQGLPFFAEDVLQKLREVSGQEAGQPAMAK